MSIVISHKDSNPKFLQNCIESLENQVFKQFEVLFVYQSSAFLKQQLQDSPLNYRLIQTDLCETSQIAKNIGIQEAQGEYILFLDSDDYLHRNALTYAMTALEKNEALNVLKLRVVKTKFDKFSTFTKIRQPFYQEDTLTAMETVFHKLNVSLSKDEQLKFINLMYEEELLKAPLVKIKTSTVMKKLTTAFKTTGLIIKKTYILEHQLFFDEENALYGQMPLLFKLYDLEESIYETKVNLYYKLIHNDTINYPALSQEEKEERSFEFVQAFRKSFEIIESPILRKQIKNTLLKYYLYKVVKKEYFNRSIEWALPIYKELQQVLSDKTVPMKVKKSHKIELQAILKGHFKLAYKVSKKRVFSFKLMTMLKPKNKRYRQKKVQKYIFAKRPIKQNTIVYESFLGRNYSDSPKALFNYLLENEKDKWHHVWIVNDRNLVKDLPEFQHRNVKIIQRFSWQYFYYVTVSKYFILNMRQPKWLVKKDEQVLLSTWHGTPLKRLVFDMDNVASANPKYKRDFYLQSRNWDFLIAANKYSEDVFASAFMYPRNQTLTYGYPRNDILKNYTEQYKEDLKRRLNIPEHKKILLYAPTWRDDEFHSVGQYKFNLRLDLQQLRERIGNDYIVLLRMHYFISDNLDLSDYEGFAFDFSKYNDINDLYIMSDILMTDYSSVFFDFASLRRPILYFTYDIDKYKDVLRGFYIDMEKDLPGPLLYTTEEVISSIENIDSIKNQYAEKYNAFYNRFCSLEDGQASKRIIEKVMYNIDPHIDEDKVTN